MNFLITLLLLFVIPLYSSDKDSFLLEGKITIQSKKCNAKEATVWLSKGKQLLFQSIVPIGGDFSFYVIPAKYDLIATTKNGCLATNAVHIQKENQTNLNLQLLKYDKAYAKYIRSKKKRMVAGMTIGTSPSSCYICQMYQAPMFHQNNWGFINQYANYGRLMYGNFNRPCAWSGRGCAGNLYRPGGPAVLGKPNIYFSQIPKQGVKLKIKLPNRSRMIATVPKDRKAWRVKRTQKDNIIKISGTSYEYIHYDYRAFVGKLQNQEGFCTNKDGLIPKLNSILENYQFTKSSVKDFEEYFNGKIPEDSSYCVYPQLEKEIESISKLEFTPKPKHFFRINFIVVPESTRSVTDTKFKNKPKKQWLESKPKKKKGFSVMEWGMGFLVGKKVVNR